MTGPSPAAAVTLPPLPAPVDRLWHVLLDLASGLRVPWTLPGGQMVLLHALEHGQVPPQISQDGDLVGPRSRRPARDRNGRRRAGTRRARRAGRPDDHSPGPHGDGARRHPGAGAHRAGRGAPPRPARCGTAPVAARGLGQQGCGLRAGPRHLPTPPRPGAAVRTRRRPLRPGRSSKPQSPTAASSARTTDTCSPRPTRVGPPTGPEPSTGPDRLPSAHGNLTSFPARSASRPPGLICDSAGHASHAVRCLPQEFDPILSPR
jgi:hypothetical protein